METKKVKVKEKEFEVHELLAVEFDEIQKIEDDMDRIAALIKKSSNLSDEDYNRLTLKERSGIMSAINELNGWTEDFQSPPQQSKKE